MKSPITTHILDTARGRPAEGVAVALEMLNPMAGWEARGQGITDADGRVSDLLPAVSALERGTYRLTFDTGTYFLKLGTPSFYPYVSIVFEIKTPDEHYHVPLLLNPFGYTTYRGS